MPPDVEPPAAPVPDVRLRNARVIWAALLFGMVAYGAVVAQLLLAGGQPDSTAYDVMRWAPVGFAAAALPAALVVRGVVHGKGRRSDGVAPGPWFTGNLIFWALCEGAVFFALVMTQILGLDVAPAAAGGAALLAFLTGFPRGDDLSRS